MFMEHILATKKVTLKYKKNINPFSGYCRGHGVPLDPI